ncbi:MAG: isoleucine--tRNA ligase [Clostridiales bacterium]|jgi:isoleucyl-tRNA synthetase|nr:isoleucine--tRNA ligase [Clostridiales bacterium]
MYSKVDTSLNFVDRELETLKFWKENQIFKKSVELRKDSPPFGFYDGPPTANGRPHIGHVETRAIKDIIPRYRTMKGYNVLRKAGWDTHGLPVELEVEKALNISGKPQIEEYGVAPFIAKCRESVWKYKEEWEEMSDRVAFWADMDSPYITYNNSYIESEWWALKQIWDKGLIYKGYKVVPYCPRCGTALSSHEVAQGYEDVTETSVYVKFKLKDRDEYILAWTTTPWTLPSNVALAANAKEEYSKVSCAGETYIMASALLNTVLSSPFEVLDAFPGSSLEGLEYENLFGFYEADEKCCYVICDSYVTLTDGTGIVHIAPAFGEDDARLGARYGLPFVQLVNTQGLFVESVAPWAGMFVKDADPLIIENLRSTGKLYKEAAYEHSYPFCWRCNTPLIYYARNTWFIKMTAVKENLIENNNGVNWYPDNVKSGRFGNFLENVVDWGLSRERYWGAPLPVWECACGYKHLIGSVDELRRMCPDELGEIELHKPSIDAVRITCPECGSNMARVPEVVDCWFDSGCMPFAQWHYPFENKESFEKFFPACFISEAVDQTRGWFYSLIAISTAVFGCSSYKNVIVMGHVQDKFGLKMSKHKGNVINPWEVLNKQGADAVRWYFYSSSAPWLPSRFYEDAVNESQRKFMGTVWNTYAFYTLYAEIDKFNPYDYSLDFDKLNVMDKWILSRMHSLIKKVDGCLDRYEITEPARAMANFADELSNWYVRRSRERYWGKDMLEDKINAFMTLHHVLSAMSKITAPFTPFMAEAMYQNIIRGISSDEPESVHLCDFPVSRAEWVDPDLEKSMSLAMQIVVLGRAARNEASIKNRQPLALMYVVSQDAKSLGAEFLEIILQELNVEKLEFAEDSDAYTLYKFKPQLKALGPRYGKLLPKISAALAASDGNELMKSLRRGQITLDIEGASVTLSESDVLVESSWQEGFSASSVNGITAVLSTRLTPELLEKGYVREIVSKIQTMRKEAGFEVTDRIHARFSGSDVIKDVITKNRDEISGDVLANSILEFAKTNENAGKAYEKSWLINGEETKLSIFRE